MIERFTCSVLVAVMAVLSGGASALHAATIAWTDTATGRVFSGNTISGAMNHIASGLSSPWGIAADGVNDHLYVADAGTRQIVRYNLDGSGRVVLANSAANLRDIELDLANQKMYWTAEPGIVGYSDFLYRSNLDGTNVEALAPNRWNPMGLALDVPNGKMYWSEFNYERYEMRIQRANLDGSSIEHIVWTGGVFARDIDLDLTNGKVYWTDHSNDFVRRANLDGTSVEEIIAQPGIGVGIQVDSLAGKLFIAHANGVLETDLDGGNQRMLFAGASAQHIALIESSPVPEPTSLVLLSGLGVMGMIAARRRKRVA